MVNFDGILITGDDGEEIQQLSSKLSEIISETSNRLAFFDTFWGFTRDTMREIFSCRT